MLLPGSLSLHLNRAAFSSPSNYCALAGTWALRYCLTPARGGEAAAGEPHSVWAAKGLISRLKARQAQASPCYPLLLSPPHSGIPVPPTEIPGERFPRDTRCVAGRDLQPCVTDSGLVQLHQHRGNQAMPVAHSQQPPRQSAGTHPGSTEPDERVPGGRRSRWPGCEKPQRQWHLGHTCPPPALGWDPRVTLLGTSAGRSSSAAQPHHTRQKGREGPAPGRSQAPPPNPARPRKRPGTAARGGARARGALAGRPGDGGIPALATVPHEEPRYLMRRPAERRDPGAARRAAAPDGEPAGPPAGRERGRRGGAGG